jgi:hypothetical protein
MLYACITFQVVARDAGDVPGLDRLALRYGRERAPCRPAPIDFFVSTVDPLEEPPLITVKTPPCPPSSPWTGPGVLLLAEEGLPQEGQGAADLRRGAPRHEGRLVDSDSQIGRWMDGDSDTQIKNGRGSTRSSRCASTRWRPKRRRSPTEEGWVM